MAKAKYMKANELSSVFFGATKFSEEILRDLLANGFAPEAIFTIPETFRISYNKLGVKNCTHADLSGLAAAHGIPLYEVDGVDGKRINDYHDLIRDLKPDLLLVMGWYYMIPRKIRNLARHGAWGIHASLLPKYAGGAPLVWAIINGEKETGATLFRFEDGVDDGDIIAQESFSIGHEDTIKEVYGKALEISRKMLANVLSNLEAVKYTPQDKGKVKVFPQRSPADGEIDLSKTAEELHNFIRAQAPPYPGAFIRTRDGRKLVIEKARVEDF